MTARLGKGLRKGSRAEPGHQRAEYAHFSYNRSFRVETGCQMHPRACFWVPGSIFRVVLMICLYFGWFFKGG